MATKKSAIVSRGHVPYSFRKLREGEELTNEDEEVIASEGSMILMGNLVLASDFPTLEEVSEGFTYYTKLGVTDNDPAKTNTGAIFPADATFYWTGAAWQTSGGSSLPSGTVVYKGDITVAADFPTAAEVQDGWLYGIAADVTDNDPTKTNTGQTFVEDDEVFWGGSTWRSSNLPTPAAGAFDNSSDPIVPYDPTKGFSLGATNVVGGVSSVAEGYGNTTIGDYAHAEGNVSIASGSYSHAEGAGNATGLRSHAEGLGSAHGEGSHAEGLGAAYGLQAHAEGNGIASGEYSHAEGNATIASGKYAHAEGDNTRADGMASHAEGKGGAYGDYSHAEGNGTQAQGEYSHAEGASCTSNGLNSHAEGVTTATSSVAIGSHSEGSNTRASGSYSHAEGYKCVSLAENSHAEGSETRSNGAGSHAEGTNTLADVTAVGAHAEGSATIVTGIHAHVEGNNTTASGTYAHAEGQSSRADGMGAHAEGKGQAYGDYAHAEGNGGQAQGDYSHTEGASCTAYGVNSHCEGVTTNTATTALGAHTEGLQTSASGTYSHAEGANNVTMGSQSHAEGYLTRAIGDSSHSAGREAVSNIATSNVHAGGKHTVAGDAQNVDLDLVIKTTDAVATKAAYNGGVTAIGIETSEVWAFEVRAAVKQDSSVNFAMVTRSFVVYQNAGTMIIISDAAAVVLSSGSWSPALDLTLTASGGSLELNATGVAVTNLTWSLHIGATTVLQD